MAESCGSIQAQAQVNVKCNRIDFSSANAVRKIVDVSENVEKSGRVASEEAVAACYI